MTDKSARQAAIVDLVRRHRPRTQAQLLAGLRKKRLTVDQSTLSRDLVELGVRKSGGRYVLETRRQSRPGPVDYSNLVERFMVCGPHLVVVSTGVGQAQPVAVAIEQYGEPAVVATLAGDDTVFVATRNRKTQTVVLRRFEQWFGDKYER